jgi:lipopolysaccharide/colanic/teichoic acid biosynthesis glycosyltransferase
VPRSKRLLDLAIAGLALPVWAVAMTLVSLAVGIFSGWPIFYASKRRVYRDESIRALKFRTMVRNAEQIANRETIPVGSQRFLNIPHDSPLYTRVGRCVERLFLTELPQVLHVLSGKMTIVGNRPLPENVIASLEEEFPYAEDRFLVRAGLLGPVQLVGREDIPDDLRLHLEITYCELCLSSYTIWLDLALLAHFALVVARILPQSPSEEIERLMHRYAQDGLGAVVQRLRSARVAR